MEAAFVDVHSHVIPSGDDGAQSLDEGWALCAEAARRGTGVLYGTPHVWPHLPLTAEREVAVREAYGKLRREVALDLRLGFELTPSHALLSGDPRRYVLEGTDCVLMEVPFLGGTELLNALAGRVERAGLRPVIAHPERTEAVLHDPTLARRYADRGWLVQVNSTSITGRHGPEIHELAWSLLHEGTASLVASDGHRETRPAVLDTAFELALARLGRRAISLFDGSALGATAATPASRAGARDA